jgi:hypothetical protein
MKVELADSPEYENVFAEICYQGECWARVIYDPDKGDFYVVIFPQFAERHGGRYLFLLDEVQSALGRAKEGLVSFGFRKLE